MENQPKCIYSSICYNYYPTGLMCNQDFARREEHCPSYIARNNKARSEARMSKLESFLRLLKLKRSLQ